MSNTPFIQKLVEEYNALFQNDPTRWDDVSRNEYACQTVDLFGRATKRPAPRTLLDFGCGSGHSLSYFQNHWPEAKLYGLDLSPEAIKYAQKRLPKANFVVGTLEQAKFDTQFDLITVLGVLEHCENPVETLKKIALNLTESGLIYVEVPNCIAYPESEKKEGFRPLRGRSRQIEWHLYRSSWENLIAESGLSISLSLKGPNQEVEFIWILTRNSEKITAYWKLLFQFFQVRKRLKRELTINMKARIVRLTRRLLGDRGYERLKSVLWRRKS